MTKYTTKQDRTEIYTLFYKAGIKAKELQREMIASFTYCRTEHTTNMYRSEAIELKDKLKGMAQKNDTPEQRMRRKFLHIAHLLGWKQPNGKVDIDRLNAWLRKYGMYHKSLNEMNKRELARTLGQFETFYESTLKQV